MSESGQTTATPRDKRCYLFGRFRLDGAERALFRDEKPIPLSPKAFEVLWLLVANHGHLVDREALMSQVWPDTFVEEHNLTVTISLLRKLLNEMSSGQESIETVPKRGYRFVATVKEIETEQTPDAMRPKPAVRTDNIDAAEVGLSRTENESQLRNRKILFGIIAVAAFVIFATTLKIATLRDWFGKAKPVRIQSIAVLPLKNLSSDSDQDYFADGMTEALITDLGNVSALRVISHTSVRQYKDTVKPLQQVARELQVDAVVEGTVARSGDGVRITANLVQAFPERHIWANSYERRLRDVLELQGELAQGIANQISVAVTPAEGGRLATSRTVDPEAYELYLKGRYFSDKKTKEDLNKSIEYFQEALNKDPGYAPAYVGLAISTGSQVFTGQRPNDIMPRARALVFRALEIDPNLAEAHTFLACLRLWYDYDWAGAEREFRRAVDLNSNEANAHQFFASYLTVMGRFNEAKVELQRAHQLDPLSILYMAQSCWDYSLMREDERAIAECKNALEIDPNSALTHITLALIYETRGAHDQFFRELEAGMIAGRDDPGKIAALRTAFKTSGVTGLWKKQIELGEDQSEQDRIPEYDMILAYANIGQTDKALTWLQKAYDRRAPFIVGLKVDPGFDPLRSDPRFQAQLHRMQLAP